jgi:hypothetical protein
MKNCPDILVMSILYIEIPILDRIIKGMTVECISFSTILGKPNQMVVIPPFYEFRQNDNSASSSPPVIPNITIRMFKPTTRPPIHTLKRAKGQAFANTLVPSESS